MEKHWLERWEAGRTGWHEAEGNSKLKEHWRATGRRVLVPMCGKSADMKWLADQGNQVFGVELSHLAIKAFFAEQALDYTVHDGDPGIYQAREAEITIFCGNYFNLKSLQCDAHYDRGAFIAIAPELRPAYAAHTSSLLVPNAEQLVISLDYDDAIAIGPPFSVSDEEVLSYWPHLVCIDEHDDILNAPPKFTEAGLTEMIEKVWRSP